MRALSRGLLPALFLFVLLAAARLDAGDLIWRLVGVTPADQATAATLHGLGFEHFDLNDGRFEVVATPAGLELIRSAGLTAEILIDDYGKFLAGRNAGAARLAAAGGFAYGSMGGYFSPDEILIFIDSLRAAHHDSIISDTLVVGESLQGRPVWMVELGGAGNADAPEVFFNSLIHAREGASVMSLLYFIRYLADSYATVDSVRWLLDNRRLLFVPMVNPDGYEINWQYYDNEKKFGLWRKNARDNDGDGRNDGINDGVDLNRNFDYKWGYDGRGSSSVLSADDFRGDSAFSEPESRVMRELVAAHNFRVAINCHTYGNDLLKPWSYIPADTPDSATFNRLGALLIAGTGYVHGNATAVLNYPANGEITDWEYGDSAVGGIIAWTAEIGDKGSFWPPADKIEPFAAKVLPLFFSAARAAGFWPRVNMLRSGAVEGRPRRISVVVNVDNAGLGDTDRPYTVALRGISSGSSVLNTIQLDSSAAYPFTDSLTVDFAPEVYQLDATLVVEQDGLVVTSQALTLTRATRDVSGDLDGNGRTDIFDLIAVLRVISKGVPAGDDPLDYDLNSDGKLDIFDLLDMLARLRTRH